MIAIVTGAGSGIGRAVTAALIKEGFSVVLAGRRVEPLTAARQHADPEGEHSRVVATDITDPASVDPLFEATAYASAGSTCSSTTPASARRECRSKI